MNGNDMFYAMLFGGDWSGSDFRNAIANYLRIETGYSLTDCEAYLDAVKKYENYELDCLCAYRFNTVNDFALNSREFIGAETGFSLLQIERLADAEDSFHRLLTNSYDRITMLLAA